MHHGGGDPGYTLRELPRWEKLTDSVIFLDGFTGAHPGQYRLAQIMIRCAREVVCTLTVDLREELYRECGIQHLFYMSRHTACRLKRLADEAGVRLREDVRCGRRPAWRFAQCPGAGISWSGTCTAMGERSGRKKQRLSSSARGEARGRR